jgi:Flp pilus assembly protein TadD
VRLHIALIVLAGVLVYGNALSGPLLFDDETSILNNTSIRRLTPLSGPLSPPRDTPVAGRPVVNLTFAVNYAMGGLDVTGYHVTNVLVHVLAALMLYGIVRRALRMKLVPSGWSHDADYVALAAAILWVVHPLNSESVNYLTERTESLMAFFYLTTLYASIRAAEAHGPATKDQARRGAGRELAWIALAVVASALGMASKESMITAPVMVLIFDRVFVYKSFREMWNERRVLYIGLAASWIVLGLILWSVPRTSVGFESGATPWNYFLNQVQLIAQYFWLTVWPQALVLDYGLPRTLTLADVILPGLVVVTLGILTLVALWRWPMLGFLGAWVFITLSPTSSFVPIATEVGAERRMYLPMAAVAVLFVVAVRWLLVRGTSVERRSRWRIAGAVIALACVLLGARTIFRNLEYRSRMRMAETIVERRPHGRARFMLADELVRAGQHEQAIAQFQLATADYPPAHFGLATEMLAGGRTAEAVIQAQTFIRLMPNSRVVWPARDLMGQALAIEGKLDQAAEQFTLLTQNTPRDPSPFVRLGNIRLRQRRFDDGIRAYQSALQLRPNDPEILKQLGLAYSAANRMEDAANAFYQGVTAKPNDISLLNFLGRALGAMGRYADAVGPLRRLAELAPGDAQARQNLLIMEKLAADQAKAGTGQTAN